MSSIPLALPVGAALALAGSAIAQDPPPAIANQFGLRLNLVGRALTGGVFNTTSGTITDRPDGVNTASSIRLEIRYQITTPNNQGFVGDSINHYYSLGLNSAVISMTSDEPPGLSGTLQPAQLTTQQATGNSILNPDSSHRSPGGEIGLINMFRTGLDSSPSANGLFGPDAHSIPPGSPGQTFYGISNINPLNTAFPNHNSLLQPNTVWGVYSALFTPSPIAPLHNARFTVSVSQWTFWLHQQDLSDPNNPIETTYAPALGFNQPLTASFSFLVGLPTPSAAPILVLGALAAARRRRTRPVA